MATDIQRNDVERQTAYTILIVGGIVGLVLNLGALIGSYWWWGPMVLWLRDGDREQLWKPLAAVAALLFGQGIMFAAFQSARKFERTDVVLRRVLYGYNAVLQAQLLFMLLLVVNVFIQVREPLP